MNNNRIMCRDNTEFCEQHSCLHTKMTKCPHCKKEQDKMETDMDWEDKTKAHTWN